MYKFVLLGLSSLTVAGVSYALMSPIESTPAGNEPASVLLDKSISIASISTPVTGVSDELTSSLSTADTTAPVAGISSNQTAEPTQEVSGLSIKNQNYKIKSGENISSIFSKLDLNKGTLHNIIHANEQGKLFADIRPGKSLEIATNDQNELVSLRYKRNAYETLTATRSGDGFDVKLISKETETKVAKASATIHSSLFWDGKNAGLSDKLIMQLANIFAWDIDFALNLRENDSFSLTYEKLYIDGKAYDTGNILAAEFNNNGQTYTAVRYEDDDGKVSYYTPEGKNMRKTFIRTPVDFARISSHFDLKRKHPVLNRIRAHKGVDYAASTGTPIKSTGSGKISFLGRKGGYGRVVIVQHGQGYSTLYAHMSKFKKGQEVGQRVQQGDVIGYVGKSGLATGPHLHYEFRINGVHRNPLTVKFPHAESITKSQMAAFKQQTQPLLTALNQIKADAMLAHNQH